MDLTIRPANREDYQAVNRVFSDELAHHVALLPDRFRQADPVMSERWFADVLAAENKLLLVAETDGLVAGLVLLVDLVSQDDSIYQPRRFLYVDEVAVLGEFRGQGIGRRLMAAAEAWAAERGITQIELNVWQANEGAIAFYEKLGYRMVRRLLAKVVVAESV